MQFYQRTIACLFWMLLLPAMGLAEDPVLVRTIRTGTSIRSIDVSPDNSFIACGGDNDGRGYVNIWNQDGTKDQEFRFLHGVTSVKFSPDGKYLLIAAGRGEIQIWNAETWKVRKTFQLPEVVFTPFAFSPDGKLFAIGDIEGDIRVWETKSTKLVQSFKDQRGFVHFVAFAPSGKTLAVATDSSIQLYDVGSARLLQLLKHEKEFLSAICFLPDESKIISSSINGFLQAWDLNDGRYKKGLCFESDDNIYAISPLPSTSLIVLAGTEKCDLLDTTNMKRTKRIADHGWPMAVTPDGKHVLSGNILNGDVKLWEFKPND